MSGISWRIFIVEIYESVSKLDATLRDKETFLSHLEGKLEELEENYEAEICSKIAAEEAKENMAGQLATVRKDYDALVASSDSLNNEIAILKADTMAQRQSTEIAQGKASQCQKELDVEREKTNKLEEEARELQAAMKVAKEATSDLLQKLYQCV